MQVCGGGGGSRSKGGGEGRGKIVGQQAKEMHAWSNFTSKKGLYSKES